MGKKIWILGNPGSGKTYLAKQLAGHTDFPLICLDDFFWLPGWKKQEPSLFLSQVQSAIQKEENWIVEGVYPQVAFHLLASADTVIWLDPPLHTLLFRVLKRSLVNIFSRKKICNGNFESFKSLFSSTSILHYVISSYSANRKQYQGYFDSLKEKNPEVQTIYKKRFFL